jgi:hypothetical protein
VSAVESCGNVQQQKLDKVLSVVNAVANGQFHVALPGPLTAKLVLPELEMPLPPPRPPQPSALLEDSPWRALEYELFDA